MASSDSQKRTKGLPPRDPVNTNAPGLQGNKNGPPGPVGNKKGPPVAALTITTEAPTTSPIQGSPLESIGSPISSPPSSPAFPSPAFSSSSFSGSAFSGPASSTPSPTSPLAPITTSTTEASPSFTSASVASASIALTPSIYSETSPVIPTPSLMTTVLLTTFVVTSSSISVPTEVVSFPPNSVTQHDHSTLGPGQKAGIAVGTIAGFSSLLTVIFLLFKRRRDEPPKAAPYLSRRRLGTGGDSRWWPYSRTPEEIPDSLLTAEVGSGGSFGWDYRSAFAPPAVTRKSRRSLPTTLRRLIRLNPTGQNPVTPHAPGEGAPNRNSLASFFRRRSTVSRSRSALDVESPPSRPPLPTGLPPPRPPAISRRQREIEQSGTEAFLQPQISPAEVLPPAFHRSWCYRNSQITLASEESDVRSFKSVPEWVKFRHPHSMPNDGGAPPAPQAISPGPWLTAKILRRPQSVAASEEKGGSHSGIGNSDEPADIESPVLGPGWWKQTQVGQRMSFESADSLTLEKQEAWQI